MVDCLPICVRLWLRGGNLVGVGGGIVQVLQILGFILGKLRSKSGMNCPD